MREVLNNFLDDDEAITYFILAAISVCCLILLFIGLVYVTGYGESFAVWAVSI